MKDVILKQIDILRDKYKWWMNVILVTISAIIGGVISLNQNKLELNFFIFLIGLILAFIIVYSGIKLKNIQEEQNKMFEKIRRQKWK